MPAAELTAIPATQSKFSNGATCKILKGNDGALSPDVPCKKDVSFEPALVKTSRTVIDGVNGKVVDLYTVGLPVCDVFANLQ